MIKLLVAFMAFILGVAVTLVLTIDRQLQVSYEEAANITSSGSKKSLKGLITSPITDEEYAIYSALLANESYRGEDVVLRDFTRHNGFLNPSNVMDDLPELAQDTVDDYKRQMEDSRTIHNGFKLKGKVTLLSWDEDVQLYRDGGIGWSLLSAKYPQSKGVISLSNAGFNRDGTQALVNAGIGNGRYGENYFVLLQKIKGRWRVRQKVRHW